MNSPVRPLHPYLPPMIAVPKGVTREDAEKALAALVPADPADEATVDRIARALAECEPQPFDRLPRLVREQYRDDARIALTVIRETEGTR